MLADGLSKGLADLRVAHCIAKRRAGEPATARCNIDATEFQATERSLQALALDAADQPVGRDTEIFEHQFGAVDTLVAELFDLARYAEAWALFGEETGHALVGGVGRRVGFHQQREAGAMDAVGDPGLGAVDDVMVAVAFGADLDALQIGAGVRFGERKATTDFAGGEFGQPGLLLLRRTHPLHTRRHDQVTVENAAQRHPGLGNFFHDPGVGARREAQSAIVGRDGCPEQTHLFHLLDPLERVFVGVFQPQHMGPHVAFQPFFNGIENFGFLFVRRAVLGGVGHWGLLLQKIR